MHLLRHRHKQHNMTKNPLVSVVHSSSPSSRCELSSTDPTELNLSSPTSSARSASHTSDLKELGCQLSSYLCKIYFLLSLWLTSCLHCCGCRRSGSFWCCREKQRHQRAFRFCSSSSGSEVFVKNSVVLCYFGV